MGVWQVISPIAAVGRVKCVEDLSSVQSEEFGEPTVVVAGKVGGDEEIPIGACAVITPATVDILSHSAVRARNSAHPALCPQSSILPHPYIAPATCTPALCPSWPARAHVLQPSPFRIHASLPVLHQFILTRCVESPPVPSSRIRPAAVHTLFATCFDAEALDRLRKLEGKIVSLNPTGGEVKIAEASPEQEAAMAASKAGHAADKARPLKSLSKVEWAGKYAVPLSAFKAGLVGAKSLNTRILREQLAAGQVPSWVGLPQSLAIPFGSFEACLYDPLNEKVAQELKARVSSIDVSSQPRADATLEACQAAVRRLVCPLKLQEQILAEMEAAGMPAVPKEAHRWQAAWSAIVGVWASQWNVRAFLSCRNAGIRHDTLRMAVLCQRIIPADYAFVIHTTNPATEDPTELYAEVVCGLGEVLVGNFPGRALSFSAKKVPAAAGEQLQPRLLGFPSKSVKLVVEPTFIFRSDSNGEDLEGFAGAGLYESIPMDTPQESFVDYSSEPLVNDAKFRENILRKIAEVGVAVEKALGSAQDIEGVVMGGEVFVVQTRRAAAPCCRCTRMSLSLCFLSHSRCAHAARERVTCVRLPLRHLSCGGAGAAVRHGQRSRSRICYSVCQRSGAGRGCVRSRQQQSATYWWDA